MTTGDTAQPRLSGTAWAFTAIDGYAPVRPERATMSFTDDRLSATVGCNGMGGDWRIDAENRLIGGPYMSTRMFCEGLMEQEQAIGALLAANPTVTVAGNRMTLTAPGHSAELRRAD
jgi:heat shock protein HslJ